MGGALERSCGNALQPLSRRNQWRGRESGAVMKKRAQQDHPVAKLSFVESRRPGRRFFWNVTPTGDYGEDLPYRAQTCPRISGVRTIGPRGAGTPANDRRRYAARVDWRRGRFLDDGFLCGWRWCLQGATGGRLLGCGGSMSTSVPTVPLKPPGPSLWGPGCSCALWWSRRPCCGKRRPALGAVVWCR